MNNFIEKTYNGDDLGVRLDAKGDITCKLWSPSIIDLKIYFYDREKKELNKEGIPFEYDNKTGVWNRKVEAKELDLNTFDGIFYQYEIITPTGDRKRGLDPYALSMSGISHKGEKLGYGAIVDMDNEKAGEKEKSIGLGSVKNSMDMLVYEVHVRDFTIDTDIEGKGTFLGFANYIEGIEHLKKLGVTHVQLLPVQNYCTVDEGDKEYREKEHNYNWGYDPHNYFTLEGWLATDEKNPYARIREFRKLVEELHSHGIGVIMDVVYNHTYGTEIFENIAPGCYYRYDNNSYISGKTGAGPTLETRNPMVRKLVIDSLEFFVKEYGVDGFRFDLMGFIDKKTLLDIRERLGKNIVLHGEAWDFTDIEREETIIKGHGHTYPTGSDIGMFNDSIRDSVTGRMEEKGFVQGNAESTPTVRASIMGNLIEFDNKGSKLDENSYNRFAHEPEELMQYLTIHDGFTLWDKLNISYGGTTEMRAKLHKQASAILFTSQGKVILHAGVEIGRTKPLIDGDPEPHRAHTSDELHVDEDMNGIRHYHENSYSSSDFINKIRWSRKNLPVFSDIYEYYCGLSQMRREIYAFNYYTADEIRKGLSFIDGGTPHEDRVIAYRIDNSKGKHYKELIVVHNTLNKEVVFENMYIDKNKKVIMDGKRAGISEIRDSDVKVEEGRVVVPAHTSIVLAE